MGPRMWDGKRLAWLPEASDHPLEGCPFVCLFVCLSVQGDANFPFQVKGPSLA